MKQMFCMVGLSHCSLSTGKFLHSDYVTVEVYGPNRNNVHCEEKEDREDEFYHLQNHI